MAADSASSGFDTHDGSPNLLYDLDLWEKFESNLPVWIVSTVHEITCHFWIREVINIQISWVFHPNLALGGIKNAGNCYKGITVL